MTKRRKMVENEATEQQMVKEGTETKKGSKTTNEAEVKKQIDKKKLLKEAIRGFWEDM